MDRPTAAPLWMRLSCRIWGHVVDNAVFNRAPGAVRRCRCGVEYLPEDGRTTHVRHTLSCFLRHHTYVRLTDRGGVHEYVCVRCGHPLVFPAGSDRYASHLVFNMYKDATQFAKSMEEGMPEIDFSTQQAVNAGLETRDMKEVKLLTLIRKVR